MFWTGVGAAAANMNAEWEAKLRKEVAELNKEGVIKDNRGQSVGVVEGFTFIKMTTMAAYFLLVDRDLRHAHRRERRLVVEAAAAVVAVREELGLQRQEAAARRHAHARGEEEHLRRPR